MSPFESLQWIAVIFIAFLALLIMALAVWAAVKEFKKNPLKNQFDTPEDKK